MIPISSLSHIELEKLPCIGLEFAFAKRLMECFASLVYEGQHSCLKTEIYSLMIRLVADSLCSSGVLCNSWYI